MSSSVLKMHEIGAWTWNHSSASFCHVSEQKRKEIKKRRVANKGEISLSAFKPWKFKPNVPDLKWRRSLNCDKTWTDGSSGSAIILLDIKLKILLLQSCCDWSAKFKGWCLLWPPSMSVHGTTITWRQTLELIVVCFEVLMTFDHQLVTCQSVQSLF